MTIDLAGFTKRVNDGVLDPSIFLDEELYALELERIWRRSWLFIGHESMLAKNGDYITTYMGEDPVLLVRDATGKTRAYLNRCRHKGVRLCAFDRGSAKNFSCVYHNWTYSNEGALIDVPQFAAGYEKVLDRSQWGLVEVPKVASYAGFVFGNWDAGAISLDEYLGDMRYYFDNSFGRGNSGGVEMSPLKQRVRTHHNWKIAAENASDMYHVAHSHAGALDCLDGVGPYFNIDMADSNYTAVIHEDRPDRPTHTVLSARITTDPEAYDVEMATPFGAETVDYVRRRYAQMREGDQRVGNGAFISAGVFPSMTTVDVGPLSVGVAIELYHPKGPRETETWLYIFVEKDAPPEFKQYAAKRSMRLHSLTGSIVPADHENWERLDEGIGGPRSREVDLNYTFGLGGSGGTDAFNAANYGELPGDGRYGMSERGARSFYRHWAHLMQEAGR